ncbi:hypothetical protein ACFL5K_01120 [Gemmatimonadota bacterium]
MQKTADRDYRIPLAPNNWNKITSGIYLWWGICGTRGWGTLALGGGLAAFVILLLTL